MRLPVFIVSGLLCSLLACGNLAKAQDTKSQDSKSIETKTAETKAKDSASKEDKSISVSVGKTKIEIPMPGDLVPSKSKLKTLAKFISTNAPGNQLHEIFAARDTTEESSIKNPLKRNADVQTVKSLHNKMSQPIFDGVQDVLAKQMDSLMNEVAKQFGEDGDAFKTIDKDGSGPFVKDAKQFAYLYFSSVKGKDGPVERATAISICFVKGNMVMLNVHTNLDSDKDVDWAKTTAENWLKAVLEANKSDEKNASADH